MRPDLPMTWDVQEIYQTAACGDLPFEAVLGRFPPLDDLQLADLIEADGRTRMRLGRSVELSRYVVAIPDLAQRTDALDAAIDMALRWLSDTGRPEPAAIESLATQHPELTAAIREAAALSQVICSTTRVRGTLAVASEEDYPRLPCDFGPTMPDGRSRYELQTLLGVGGFGQVYLAEDRLLSEPDRPARVAIKILHRNPEDAWERHRLVEEATKARRVDHANVVRVLDRDVTDKDADFIVYEHISGGSLAKWVRRRDEPLPIREAVGLIVSIARGLHAAHMAGLVHCDLKPHNILMTSEGVPKVADFGIAVRAAELAVRADSESREPQGNLAFISPEQYRGEPHGLTVPSDLYALGGLLYWLITGQLPNGASPAEIARTHDLFTGRRAAPSARAFRPEVDRDLDAILRRSMAPMPQHRYASASEMADDLEAWLATEPIAWTRPGTAHRLNLWMRRKPGLAAALVGTAVTALGAGAVVRHYARLAADRRVKAYIAETRLQDEERMRHEFVGKLNTIQDRLRVKQRQGMSTELLAWVWGLEWIYGSKLIGQPLDPTNLWGLRLETVRSLADDAVARGGEAHVETLVWQTALAFWLIRSGGVDEVEPLLNRALAVWTPRLDAADPWLDTLRILQDCAAVHRSASRLVAAQDPVPFVAIVEAAHTGVTASPPTAETHGGVSASGTPVHDAAADASPDDDSTPHHPDDAALTALRDSLEAAAERLAAREAEPIRLLVFDSLAMLNAPGLLNDPARQAAALAQAEGIRNPPDQKSGT